jgi:alpha-acetolactate decarboxylase
MSTACGLRARKLYGITSDFTVFETVSILPSRDYSEEIRRQLDEWAVERVGVSEPEVIRGVSIIGKEVHDKYDLIHAGTAFGRHVTVLVTRDLRDYVELERKGRFNVWTPERTVDEYGERR